MKQLMTTHIKQLKHHWWDVISTLMTAQLSIVLISYTIMKTLLSLLLWVSRQTSLNLDSLGTIVAQPLTWPIIIMILMVAMASIYFEVSTGYLTIHALSTRQSVSFREIIRQTSQKMKQLASKQLPLLMAYFILMIPMANLGYGTTISDNLKIPAFISGEFEKNMTVYVLYMAALLGIAYINARFIYVFPLLVLTRKKLIQIFKHSWQLTKGKGILIMVPFTASWVVMTGGASIILKINRSIVALFDQQFNLIGYSIAGLFLTLAILITFFTKLIFRLLITQLLYTRVTVAYHVTADVLKSETVINRLFEWLKRVMGVVSISLIMGLSTLLIAFYEITPQTLIFAHRGYINGAVENSLEALELAKQYGADYVEMDVMQTKDGHFIVMHDYNLKRLAHKNEKVSDLTLESIQKLTITDGNVISRIPTFEEYIERAKSLNMRLNVEIKPHGKESKDAWKQFAELLKRYDVAGQYIVQSLNAKVIAEIEQLLPETKTGFILPFQFGGVPDLAVDFFVVEESSYNDRLRRLIELHNKELYVWTVNTKEMIREYMIEDVHGIITDELQLVLDVKEELANNTSLLQKYDNMTDYLTSLMKK